MLSLKYALVAFASASHGAVTSFSSPNSFDMDPILLLQSPEHRDEHWNAIKPLLDESFPGISCSIHAEDHHRTPRTASSLIALSIESSLVQYHPLVRCVGELQEELLAATENGESSAPAHEQKRDVQQAECLDRKYPTPMIPLADHPTTAPPDAHDVHTETQAQNKAVKQVYNAGWLSCKGSQHPALCRACWSGFITQWVAELGGCSIAAYTAYTNVKTVQAMRISWVAYLCCVTASSGKYIALSSGCPGR